MSLTTGTKLGPYEILAPIGAGGMGEVWRARDTRIGREVAIKILPPAFADDRDRLRRFEQEARTAGSLNHPNLVTIYDLGGDAGTPHVARGPQGWAREDPRLRSGKTEAGSRRRQDRFANAGARYIAWHDRRHRRLHVARAG